MNDLKTAPITIEDIRLWQESTPADYADWDEETVGDCDRFLTILVDRLQMIADADARIKRYLKEMDRAA